MHLEASGGQVDMREFAAMVFTFGCGESDVWEAFVCTTSNEYQMDAWLEEQAITFVYASIFALLVPETALSVDDSSQDVLGMEGIISSKY